MKKIYIVALMLLVAIKVSAQDPTVSAQNVSPSPALVNGPITASITFVNQSSIAITNDDPLVPTVIVISLNKIKPNFDTNNNPDVSGPGSVFFNWIAECSLCDDANPENDIWSLIGIQNQVIPGATMPGLEAGGPILIAGKVIAASTIAEASAYNGSGFNVNITPGAGGDIDPSEASNNQQTYTYTNGVLPVKLISFDVRKEGNIANLYWATTEELNSDRFEIEHSMDAKSWSMVGTVASHRESKIRQAYQFSHHNPGNGLNYYRLKMVDQDDTFAYSNIKNISMDAIKSVVNVFPNPVSDVLTIDTNLSKLSNVKLYTTSGLKIYDSGKNVTDKINVRNFGEGIYMVKVVNVDGTFTVHKVMITK
jgi:hypothetical protein